MSSLLLPYVCGLSLSTEVGSQKLQISVRTLPLPLRQAPAALPETKGRFCCCSCHLVC